MLFEARLAGVNVRGIHRLRPNRRSDMGHDADARSDRELMKAFVDGDGDAMRSLVDRYGPRIIQFATRFVGPDAACDVAQETFLALLQRPKDYNPGKDLAPWLFAIARNVALKGSRSKRRHPTVPLWEGNASDIRTPGPDPSQHLSEKEQHDELNAKLIRCLDDLNVEFRATLVLHLYGLKYVEIAQVLDCPANTVAGRLKRARSLLEGCFFGSGTQEPREDDHGHS